MRALHLKRHEDRRIRSGHLWVFSNEVDTQKSPLTDFAPGEEAIVLDARGAALGSACVNPSSLICARLHSRKAKVALDAPLLEKRLAEALVIREQTYPSRHFRLCHSEGDFLPGLVADCYGSHVTVQISTAAMDVRKALVADCLHKLLAPTSILFDNGLAARTLEGLSLQNEHWGQIPDRLDVLENDCRFAVSSSEGQKTGWFYDQRDNRQALARHAAGKSVLDVFCYAGGFGVTAAAHGARSVTFVDASSQALELACENLRANAGHTACQSLCGDAFALLEDLTSQGQRFDIVNLDPPAFIKRKKDAGQGLAAYRKLNALGMRLLTPGGILASSSCSHHLASDDLRACIALAAARQGWHARILHVGTQGADHPVHAAMPETAYLKTFIVQVG